MHFTLTDFLMDAVQNSIEAEAAHVELSLAQTDEDLTVRLADDGCGMTEGELEKAKDPFYTDGKKHKARKVGLGIPFLMQTVSMTEGSFDIQSEKGKGTVLTVRFNLKHWDTPPLGNLVTLFYQILTYPGEYEMILNRSFKGCRGEESYRISRQEMIEVLGDLEDAGAVGLLRQYIQSQEEDLREGVI